MTTVPEEIAVALGRPVPEADSPLEKQWQLWIDDAYRAIRREARRRKVDYATLDVDDVDQAVREAVVDHSRNPENATQVDIQVEDGRVSKRYARADGVVSINGRWWSILFDTGGGREAPAYTVRPTFEPDGPSPNCGAWL